MPSMRFADTEATQEMRRNRCYSELIRLPTFEERFEYLKLDGGVGVSTFGFDRYLNQKFYHSDEWKRIRDQVIVRDLGCDLAMRDYQIYGKIYIHHMNPITVRDIRGATAYLLNPEYLVCVSYDTHNAIHYGSEPKAPQGLIIRRPGDTCPWKKEMKGT